MQFNSMKLFFIFLLLALPSKIVVYDKQTCLDNELLEHASISSDCDFTRKGCGKKSKKFCALSACSIALKGTLFVNGVDYSTVNSISEAIVADGLAVPGPEGVQGDQGAPGMNGVPGILGYGYIYNDNNFNPGTLNIGAAVPFNSNAFMSGVTHTSGTTDITVTNGGTYVISFSVTCNQPNQFALFVNGLAAPLAPTSRYGVINSVDGPHQTNGQTIVTLNAGDVITLVNNDSTTAVTFNLIAGGPTLPVVTASVLILRVA